MKILIVASHLEPRDGWGTEALNTVRGLRALGHDVSALVHERFAGEGCRQDVLLPDAISLLRNPLGWLQTARALKTRLREFPPDVIHVTTELYALALPLVLRTPPVVFTANGTYSLLPLVTTLTGWLMRRAYRRVAHVLAISAYTEMRLLQELERRDALLAENVRKKTSVWTLGIEWPRYIPPRRAHPEKQLLFVGGVKPRKGVGEIIEACAAFRTVSALPFHLHLMGSCPPGNYTESLRARVRELGMESQVTFHGHVSEEQLAQAYADADLFLMLSKSHGMHFEGYGLVFLEANARGVPGIGPLDAGCVEVIAEGKSGYLVHPDDPVMVAERMRWVLEENRIRAEDCIAWARERSVERQAREAEAVYQTVVR